MTYMLSSAKRSDSIRYQPKHDKTTDSFPQTTKQNVPKLYHLTQFKTNRNITRPLNSIWHKHHAPTGVDVGRGDEKKHRLFVSLIFLPPGTPVWQPLDISVNTTFKHSSSSLTIRARALVDDEEQTSAANEATFADVPVVSAASADAADVAVMSKFVAMRWTYWTRPK